MAMGMEKTKTIIRPNPTSAVFYMQFGPNLPGSLDADAGIRHTDRQTDKQRDRHPLLYKRCNDIRVRDY